MLAPERVSVHRALRQFLPLVLILVCGCGTSRSELDFSDQNLLLITVDTLRADRLGSYGYTRAQTPNLDRMAREGVLFQNAYSAVPLTLPSHSSLFTGRYPFATSVRLNGVHYLGETETTLAELFQEQGVFTAATVASYVLTSKFGLSQGFDVYEDSLRMGDLFRFFSEIRGDEVYRRSARWLRDTAAARFFGWIHFYDVHGPYEPPEEYLDSFSDDPYDGEVAFVDAQIGRIFDELERLELLANTLIVVTSDHGEAFREHVEEGHGLLCYDETLRVPLIFVAPGRLPQGHHVTARVSLVDLLPTFVDLFELELPTGLHGRSLEALLAGGEEADTPSLYFESLAGEHEKNWAPRSGLIAGDHKFIKVPEAELYDLRHDPGERNNLFELQPDLVDRLDAELEELLLSSVGDAGSAERDLSEEGSRHLRALGYLSDTTTRSEGLLDPKRGILLEMVVRDIQTAIESGEIGTAEVALTALAAENPDLDTSDFYSLRHQIEAAKGNAREAIGALEDGLDRFPDSALAFKLAAYHLELGNLDEAEQQSLDLLERRPKFSQAINLLGLVAEERGNLEEALEMYEKANELEPNSVPLRLKIADTLVRLGDLDRAVASYEELLASGVLDGEAESLYKAAALHMMVGRLGRAEELFGRGLELEPAGRHYIGLAMVQARAGKTDSAVRSLETALDRYREDMAPQEVQLAESTLRVWRGIP